MATTQRLRMAGMAATIGWRLPFAILVTAAFLLADRPQAGLAAPLRLEPSAQAGTGCVSEWSQEPVALGWTSLTSLAATRGTLWAAGFTKRDDIRRPTMVRRAADGWAEVRLPEVSRETGLFDVTGGRTGPLWAVGYEALDRRYRPSWCAADGAGWTGCPARHSAHRAHR